MSEKKTAVLIYDSFCNFEIAPALEPDEYDSLLLPGALDIREAIEDEAILAFIRNFQGMVIGAISVAPLLLLRAGLLAGKRFMAGINPEELAEEGFSGDDLALMHGWDANLAQPVPEGYIRSDNIITSVSYGFVRWALAFGAMLGIELSPRVFGLELGGLKELQEAWRRTFIFKECVGQNLTTPEKQKAALMECKTAP